MAKGGTYRINDTEFSAPESTPWEDIPIAPGLNAIPFVSSYAHHVWSFNTLEGCLMDDLVSLWQSQLNGNAQLAILETDPYAADQSNDTYGTTIYTDFVIMSISPFARGMPEYPDVSVTFLVYLG